MRARTLLTSLTVLYLLGCPRLVVPQGAQSGGPAIELQTPTVSTRNGPLTCDGVTPSVGGYVGDLLTLQAAEGSSWDAATVQVTAGVPLERVGTATSTSVTVRLPEHLDPTPVTVASDGRRPGTTEVPVCVVPPFISEIRPVVSRAPITCGDDAGNAIAAFGGDELELIGAGWDSDAVQVRAAETVLAQRPLHDDDVKGTVLRVLLPDVLPTGPLTLWSRQQRVTTMQSVCVVGPGHPGVLAFTGTVDTRLSILAAGVAPTTPVACYSGLFDCTRHEPAAAIATAFSFSALPGYALPVYASVMDFETGLHIVKLPPAGVGSEILHARPIKVPAAGDNADPVATALVRRVFSADEMPTQQVLIDGEILVEAPNLLPLTIPGPARTLMTVMQEATTAEARFHGGRPGAPVGDGVIELPGRVAAVGIVDPPFLRGRDGGVLSAQLVAVACDPDGGALVTSAVDLQNHDVRAAMHQPSITECADADGGLACRALQTCVVDGFTGGDCDYISLLGCAQAALVAGPGQPNACTPTIACLQDRADGGCGGRLGLLSRCLRDEGCKERLSCGNRDGDVDGGCPGLETGQTYQQACDEDPGCTSAKTCFDPDPDGGASECAEVASCAFDGRCGLFACDSDVCQAALRCIDTSSPACSLRTACTFAEVFGEPQACERLEACTTSLCNGAGTIAAELVPVRINRLLASPVRSSAGLFGGDQPFQACEVDLDTGLVLTSPGLPEEATAVTVLPPLSDEDSPVYMAMTSALGVARTLEVTDATTRSTRIVPRAYDALLPAGPGSSVWAVPANGSSVDLLDRTGAYLAGVPLLGSISDAALLPGDPNRIVLVHPLVVLEQDTNGLVIAESVHPLEPTIGELFGSSGVIEHRPDGVPARVWRSVYDAMDARFEIERVELGGPGEPVRVAHTTTPVFPLVVDREWMVLSRIDLDDGDMIVGQTLVVARVPEAGSASVELVLQPLEGGTGVDIEGYAPASRMLIVSTEDFDETAIELDPVSGPRPARPIEDPGFLLTALPDGSVAGFFFNQAADRLRFELGLLRPDLSYETLAEAPAEPTAMAASPDGRRLYVAEPNALIELELYEPTMGDLATRVLSRVAIQGTPTQLVVDPAGKRVMYIDRALHVVGLLE